MEREDVLAAAERLLHEIRPAGAVDRIAVAPPPAPTPTIIREMRHDEIPFVPFEPHERRYSRLRNVLMLTISAVATVLLMAHR